MNGCFKEKGLFRYHAWKIKHSCEVVSPSAASYDTIEKRGVYEKYGVREYWLVFPQEKTIEVLSLENNIYREFSGGRKTGIIRSKIIDGLVMDLKDIFE